MPNLSMQTAGQTTTPAPRNARRRRRNYVAISLANRRLARRTRLTRVTRSCSFEHARRAHSYRLPRRYFRRPGIRLPFKQTPLRIIRTISSHMTGADRFTMSMAGYSLTLLVRITRITPPWSFLTNIRRQAHAATTQNGRPQARTRRRHSRLHGILQLPCWSRPLPKNAVRPLHDRLFKTSMCLNAFGTRPLRY